MDEELVIEQFLVSLYDIDAIEGQIIELRKAFTFPKIHKQIIELFWNKVQPLHYDLICGNSQNALAFTSSLSISKMLPMITCQERVEGEYFAGQYCLVIEDIVASGEALFQTLESLKSESLVVEDIACFIDLEQGGRQKLENMGYRVHSVLKLSDIMDILFQTRVLVKNSCHT